MNRALALPIALWALVGTTAIGQTPGTSKPDPWCRLDDPGTSQVLRQQKNLAATDIPCPPRSEPEKRPDELVLPLPCGRAMVFRKVEIPMHSVLDHQHAFLGVVAESAEDPMSKPARSVVNGPREAFVSASLPLAAEGGTDVRRGYYIGKYEVSRLQYDIHRQGLLTQQGGHADASDPACQPIGNAARQASGTSILPATEISWFDAMDFARAYTEWLLAQDRSCQPPNLLPWEQSTPAFLRLPTAAEWEYAARGGDVSQATQSKRTYDVIVDGARRAATLEEIASIKSPEINLPEGAEVNYEGRRLPNSFGIYDMVGNAAELVLDFFQPLRPDQRPSAIGGFVIMGGSAADMGGASVGVGARTEIPMFRKDGLVRSPTTGFRLVLSSPFLVNKRMGECNEGLGNPELEQRITRAYEQLVGQTSAPGSQERVAAEKKITALQLELEKARAEQKQASKAGEQTRSDTALQELTSRLQSELSSVKANLDRAQVAVNEREARLQAEQLRSLILTAANIGAVDRQVRVGAMDLEKLAARAQQTTNAEEKKLILENLGPLSAMREQLVQSNDGSFRYYVETAIALSQVSEPEITVAEKRITEQFRIEGNLVLNRFQPVVARHIASARKARGAIASSEKDLWLKEIKETKRTQ